MSLMGLDYQSTLLQILSERGFLYQCTDAQALDAFLTQPRTLYIGFDATAESLHVGSLLPLMVLRWARSLGHTPIMLLGGGTTLVGDPSGKDTARQMLEKDSIRANAKGLLSSVGQLLQVEGPEIILEDNESWLQSLNYIDFLRTVGAHFSVNRMLSMESVKSRLEREQNLSFLEFNYMLCQAYDFLHLATHRQCFIQGGGSDQWGNIVSGVDLIRRKTGKEAYGLTFPLLETRDGKKMGKTAEGAMWLASDKKKPYAYWQFWRNIHDADIERFLKLFTTLPLQEIDSLVQGNPNEAKIALADDATGLLHGYDALSLIHKTVQQVQSGRAPYTVVGQDSQGNDLLETDLPLYKVNVTKAKENRSVIALLSFLNIVESKGQARRLIRDKGLFINEQAVEDELDEIDAKFLQGPSVICVRLGKKKNILIQVCYEN